MPITIGFFSWERINHFPFISYQKNLFGIRPVWYKSKDPERIKDVYRGTTVVTICEVHTLFTYDNEREDVNFAEISRGCVLHLYSAEVGR
jgi:hypothetical protein